MVMGLNLNKMYKIDSVSHSFSFLLQREIFLLRFINKDILSDIFIFLFWLKF